MICPHCKSMESVKMGKGDKDTSAKFAEEHLF